MSQNSLYSRLANTVVTMLTNCGTRATLIKKSPKVYHPETSMTIGGDIIETGLPIVVVMQYTTQDKSGGNIKAHDAKVMMAAASTTVTPDIGNTLIIKNTFCEIIDVSAIQPDGGTVIMYTLQCRPVAGSVIT